MSYIPFAKLVHGVITVISYIMTQTRIATVIVGVRFPGVIIVKFHTLDIIGNQVTNLGVAWLLLMLIII